MTTKITNYFNQLKPAQKKIVALMGIGSVLTVIGIGGYISSIRTAEKNAAISRPSETKNPINMDGDMLKTSQLLDARKEAQMSKEELIELKKRDEATKKAIADGLTPPLQSATPALPTTSTAVPQAKGNQKLSNTLPPIPRPTPGNPMMPQPVPEKANFSVPPPPMQSNRPEVVAVETEIGGISQVINTQKTEEKEDKKKEEKRSVYLPISYMEATLLSGLDAPTSSEGRGNPVPVLIRVKLPAVLPNDVKANLRGCFVVADGKGNLGTERAELVLATLSCIDRKGQAVIDQPLTGYVVDADGKAGLRGRVVTKMGAIIVRTMMAGMFSGFGDALSASSTTSSMSALGATQTIDPKNVATAGLGKGISSAFKEIEKFYLELAHATLPVIEIGAARPITLVLTKGATLNIMKIKGGR